MSNTTKMATVHALAEQARVALGESIDIMANNPTNWADMDEYWDAMGRAKDAFLAIGDETKKEREAYGLKATVAAFAAALSAKRQVPAGICPECEGAGELGSLESQRFFECPFCMGTGKDSESQ